MKVINFFTVSLMVVILAGCSSLGTRPDIDPTLIPIINKAVTFDRVIQFSGAPLWDNKIQFTVGQAKGQDVALAPLRNTFDSQGIATTRLEIERLSNFIALLSKNPVPHRGKTIDLAEVLKVIRSK